MPFVELFLPQGSLCSEQRNAVGARLVGEVMRAEGAPDTEAARSISWMVVREIEEFWIGSTPWSSGLGPRYVVRIAVPAGSLDDDKRLDMVRRVTKVLADADPEPARLTREPVAWVHINEIPDGNWGARGEVVRLKDIGDFVRSAQQAAA